MAEVARRSLGPVLRTYLPVSLAAPRQARAAVRQAMTAWGLGSLSAEAELLASELVANSVEHGGGELIGLTISQHSEPSGKSGILCQVTDSGPGTPTVQPLREGSERGRGLQIVSALATKSGVTRTAQGKTTWFTLTAWPEATASTRHVDFEPEPGD